MKLLKFFILFFCFIGGYAQSSWQAVPNITPNINNQRFDDVFFLNEDLGWAANGFYASVFKTTDGGLTWTEQLNESDLVGDYYFRNIIFLDSNVGFLGTLNGDFFKTIDGGDNWSIVNNISPNPNAICGLEVVGTSTIYGCGAYFEPAHIIKSTDSGDTWQYIDMSAYATGLVEIKFISELVGYVAGKSSTGAIILKTTDGGSSWTEIYNSNIAGEFIWKLQVLENDNDIIFGALYAMNPNPGKLVTSDNAGATWSSFNAPESGVQAVGFINENTGWMGGHTTGFYETNDGGETWTDISVGNNLNRIFIINESLAYASGTSVYKFTSETLSPNQIKENYNGNPLSVTLNENPVNNQLKFSIHFESSDNILINLYDIKGKFIKHLKRDIIPIQIKKEYNFDVSTLASGSYIISFHNNLGRISKQFIKK